MNITEVQYNTKGWTPGQIEALKVASVGLATIREQGEGVIAVESPDFSRLFEEMVNHLRTTPATPEPEVVKPVPAEIPIKRAGLRNIFDFGKRIRVRV